jgi:hypothetical protein
MSRFIALAIVVVTAAGGAIAQQRPTSFIPGLGDLMTMTVQPRHTKLGLAVREGNWGYAAYELHELQEAFAGVTKASPRWRNFPIAEMIRSVTKEPMAALEQAIKAADSDRSAAAYEQLTAACNTCHRSAERGVIVIQPPSASAFPDQDFRPVKE